MPSIASGDQVKWQWGRGFAVGTVRNVYPGKISFSTDGYDTTRHGDESDPVLRIETPAGHALVKLSSEVESLRA